MLGVHALSIRVCVCVLTFSLCFLVGNFSSDELNWDQEEAFGADYVCACVSCQISLFISVRAPFPSFTK